MKRALFAAHELDKPLIEKPESIINDRYNMFSRLHKISLPKEQADYLRTNLGEGEPLDLILKGGEEIRLGYDWYVRILHTPGHTHGHISLYDQKNNALFVGDAVQGKTYVTIDGNPAFPPTYYCIDQYIRTIDLLRRLKPKYLFTAHYAIMEGDAIMKFLDESERFGKELEQEVMKVLKEDRSMSMIEIIKAIHKSLGDWKDEDLVILTLCCPLSGHLERLIEKGVIRSEIKNDLLRYYLK